MTPKEKAKELVEKYRDVSISFVDSIEGTCDMYINNEDAKECALIAVDEMIKELDELLEGDERQSTGVYYLWKYYKEVKQEIELL